MRFTKCGAACAFAAIVTTTIAVRADELDDARSLYDQGKALYDRGDYQEALARFSRAYALRPVPALLFNMAQASRLSGKGHCAEALGLYERYLERDPAPENLAEVHERITQMQACARDEPSPATAAAGSAPGSSVDSPPGAPVTPIPVPASGSVNSPSTPPPPRSERPPEHSLPLAAVLATGIGAALAISGGVLYLSARSKFDEARGVCPCPEGKYSEWETLTTVSYVLMATGVVVSGTGATFWILSGKSDTPATAVSGAGLRFTGRF
jgi:tetratricopeptide (TPR) repeat protein